MEDTISEVFTECWARLLYGSIIADNAFRTAVVAIQSGNEVNMRTVVLRATDPDKKQVLFYTDSRSPKVAELEYNANISFLFYDEKDRVQVKVSGKAVMHHQDDVAASYWDKVSAAGRKAYMAMPAPSTAVNEASDGLEYLNDNTDTQTGYQNFMVVVTEVDYIEWLTLAHTGHRRAQFKLINDNWKGQWLIP